MVLEEWMNYSERITETYPNFFLELSKVHPDLTRNQIKLCALFLFECEPSEIAERMGSISIEAVVSAKYRLKKKFKPNMKNGERLVAYLHRIAAGLVPPPPSEISRFKLAHAFS